MTSHGIHSVHRLIGLGAFIVGLAFLIAICTSLFIDHCEAKKAPNEKSPSRQLAEDLRKDRISVAEYERRLRRERDQVMAPVLAAKADAVRKCEALGNIAMPGYGWEVVCLQKTSVAFTVDCDPNNVAEIK